MKKKFTSLIVIILFFSCNNSPATSKNNNFPVLNYVIIPYNQENKQLFKESIPADLTKDDIINIDNILPMIISEHNKKVKANPYVESWMNQELDLSRYLRQYVPVLNKNGEKEVFVNCFAADKLFINGWKETWNSEFLIMSDGGNDYFEIIINLNTGTYSHFYIHGYA
ncbi:MAG: hypothetical protein LBB89_11535 [Treponema sp.]|nr:hypothetical protein [Treponema sp.]